MRVIKGVKRVSEVFPEMSIEVLVERGKGQGKMILGHGNLLWELSFDEAIELKLMLRASEHIARRLYPRYRFRPRKLSGKGRMLRIPEVLWGEDGEVEMAEVAEFRDDVREEEMMMDEERGFLERDEFNK